MTTKNAKQWVSQFNVFQIQIQLRLDIFSIDRRQMLRSKNPFRPSCIKLERKSIYRYIIPEKLSFREMEPWFPFCVLGSTSFAGFFGGRYNIYRVLLSGPFSVHVPFWLRFGTTCTFLGPAPLEISVHVPFLGRFGSCGVPVFYPPRCVGSFCSFPQCFPTNSFKNIQNTCESINFVKA